MPQHPGLQSIYGDSRLVSPWFSNSWVLLQGDTEVARLERLGRIYVTIVTFGEGARITLEPHGLGVVAALDAERTELARITRRSWTGRRWDIGAAGFSYELVSHPRPRRWFIAVGGAPVAEIRGSLISYNTVVVEATLAVPVAAILLAWHVIARPWEAAAAPRGLVALPRPSSPPRTAPAIMEEPT